MSTVNIWISKRTHTDLIGKGGAVVKKLSSDHNVSIKIPQRDDPTSMIQILGTPDNAQKAIKAIEEIIGKSVSLEPFVTLQLDIPSSVHGLLIGKGGATLRDIESQSHASVNIPKREDPKGTYVTVEGTKDATNKAKEMMGKVIGSPVKVVGGSVEQITLALEKVDLNKSVSDALFFPDTTNKNHEKFLKYLSSATKTLDICVFTITDDRVSRVIEDAHRSGVKVRLISDDECLSQIGSDIQSLAKKLESLPSRTIPRLTCTTNSLYSMESC
jgi:polyribonucleotide nucleotidyltransferase